VKAAQKCTDNDLQRAAAYCSFLYETRIKFSGKWLTGRICVTTVGKMRDKTHKSAHTHMTKHITKCIHSVLDPTFQALN